MMEAYEILNQVGRGAFGYYFLECFFRSILRLFSSVFLCCRRLDKREVIMKQLHIAEANGNEKKTTLLEVKVIFTLHSSPQQEIPHLILVIGNIATSKHHHIFRMFCA